MRIREKITFYGRVQAVGFRYRSQQFAKETGLAGTVKNLSDGSVEMEIEGDEREINEFLDKLCHSPYIKVVSLKTEPMEVKQEKEFRIIN